MDGFEALYADIHNRNACGYGIGSMERSIAIAGTRLDFFAFTGHPSWHDIAPVQGGRETSRTVRAARARGLRFGFVASSDSHHGFPRAWDVDLPGLWNRGRDRTAILGAIRARVPGGPGLGIAIDESKVARFAADLEAAGD